VRQRGPHPLPLFLAIAARVCAGDRARLADVLKGLARYQALPPALPRPLAPEVLRVGGVVLRDHGGTGGDRTGGEGRPVLVVPSLINPPHVLDLGPGRSLLAGLRARGLRPLMLDWGMPEPLGLAALVAERLVPVLEGLGEPVPVLGYCLGGTLAVALAALAPVERLALLAAPWHFSGYEDTAQAQLADWWAQVAALAAPLGAVPMEMVQPAFWALDEAGLVAKYARLVRADADTLAVFAELEDWSNSGVPLALAAAGELADGLFGADLSGRGQWRVGGERVDVGRLKLPVLDVIAGRDRIVPAAAALSRGGVGTPLLLPAGHVGMVVGRRGQDMLWAPLAAFLGGDGG
jgi:polyhydroxyalkanoate synthase